MWCLIQTSQCYQDVQQALAQSGGRHKAAKALQDSLQKEAVTMRTQALELSLEGRKQEAVRKISSAIERNPTLAEYHVFRCLLVPPMMCVAAVCLCVVASHAVSYASVGGACIGSWVASLVLRKTSTRPSTSADCPRTTPP